uniref:Uncharacterized protein LOC104265840 n=1 Tax=Phallusia mammillata TaxID=59560 RepID=A0A6F9DJM2_9ASCI|nr:uncharacterized protein LOC104265840 [Phallusia mammillata]
MLFSFCNLIAFEADFKRFFYFTGLTALWEIVYANQMTSSKHILHQLFSHKIFSCFLNLLLLDSPDFFRYVVKIFLDHCAFVINTVRYFPVTTDPLLRHYRVFLAFSYSVRLLARYVTDSPNLYILVGSVTSWARRPWQPGLSARAGPGREGGCYGSGAEDKFSW